jgi:hypothetical protein
MFKMRFIFKTQRLKMQILCCLFSIIALCSFTFAQAYTPKTGSVERKALMDALRLPVEKELGKKVAFKIDHLKVQDDWAFMRGIPQQPNGKAMDYQGTSHQEAIKEGMFDDGICALLKKQDDKWTVVIYQIGATDVPWVSWNEEYKAPATIFK